MTVIASSLNNKLVAFAALLVLVPGVVVGLLAARSGRESLQRIIGAQLARESAHIADELDALLRAEQETLRSFAAQGIMREIRVDDIDKRISRALATLRDGSAIRRDYLVLDRNGRVVAASDAALFGTPPERLPDDMRRADSAPPIHGPLALSASSGRALLISTPTPDPDDPERVLGILIGLLDWEVLSAGLRELEDELRAQGIRAGVLIADAKGEIVSGPTRAAERAALPLVLGGLRAEDRTSGHRIDEDAGYIIGSSERTRAGSFQLLVVQSLDDALRPARELSRNLALTVGLALVVALLAATGVARRIIRPLSELTASIRDLPRTRPGSLRVSVRSSDEVGVLGEAFNQVAQELDRVQRELVEAERYAAVGEFASGVAHHVRTSLGVLRSSAQMLERAVAPASERERELAELIRSEVDRLAGVVNDLLDLGRRRERDHKPSLLSEPAERAVALVTPRAEERQVKVRFQGMAGEPRVHCDAESIHQACVNLLVNAIDVVEERSEVSLELYRAEDGWVGIEIRDSGPGVPESIREQIFDPFVSGREGGVGLGLTYVQRVVREHAGRIEVGAAHPRGTRIRLELPLTRAEGAAT